MTLGWPSQHKEWLERWRDQAIARTALRLSNYPVLAAFYKQTAERSAANAQEISTYLEHFEEYFQTEAEFGRWFGFVCYREALRLVVRHEPVDDALCGLDPADRCLLNWSYVDQFTEEQIANLIIVPNLEATPTIASKSHACSKARDLVLEAYGKLCAVIERRKLVPQHFVKKGRYRDVSSLFPLPPAITRTPQQC